MSDFETIFNKYHRPLFLYAMKFVNNEDDALDIVQEVFIRVWKKGRYKLEMEHLKSFLFNSVKNGCLNFLKHQAVINKHWTFEKQKLVGFEFQHYNNGEKSLIEKENLNNIHASIDTLSDIYKEVIKLSRFENLKNCQIAEKLNIPIRTVETRLYRALLELKQKLSKKHILILFNYNASL